MDYRPFYKLQNSESAQYREKSFGFRMWRPLALGGDQRGEDKNDVEIER